MVEITVGVRRTERIPRRIRLASRANVTGGFGFHFTSGPAGIRSWGRFRYPTSCILLPPSLLAFLVQNSLFFPGEKFQLYLLLLERADALEGYSLARKSAAVVHMGKELGQARCRKREWEVAAANVWDMKLLRTNQASRTFFSQQCGPVDFVFRVDQRKVLGGRTARLAKGAMRI